MIVLVSHDDVPFLIHCDSTRMGELRNRPFSVSMANAASARQSGHMALRSDLADTMVVQVGHDDVAVPIHCDGEGAVELSNCPFSVFMPRGTSACQSGHTALWCNYADTVVLLVSHGDAAVPIHWCRGA